MNAHTTWEKVLARNGDEAGIRDKYERRYFPAERHYLRECRPLEGADWIVSFEGERTSVDRKGLMYIFGNQERR